jgi:hypothetical protein
MAPPGAARNALTIAGRGTRSYYPETYGSSAISRARFTATAI